MSKFDLNKKYKSKNQLAYDELKSRIVRGYFKPGSMIVISEMAKSYGISEIPVREALKELEAENFVQHLPHVGFVVTKPSFENQTEIFQVRQLLEGYATWLAASQISSKALENMKDLIKEMKKNPSYGEARLADLNYQFHDLIYSSCGNSVLYKLIEQVWAMAPRTRSIYSLVKGRAQTSTKEHEEIYRYLAEGNPERAKKALLEHKQKSYDLLCRYEKSDVNQQPE